MTLSQIKEPTTPSELLLNNVLVALEQRMDRTYRAVRAYELAPGAIAIDDSLGETDVFFDLSMWDFAHPMEWLTDDSGIHRNIIDGVGVLAGVERMPRIAGPSMALEFARGHLTATVSAEWHTAPKQL